MVDWLGPMVTYVMLSNRCAPSEAATSTTVKLERSLAQGNLQG